MTNDTDLISKLNALKSAYDENLISKDDYDKYRLKILDDWSNSELKNISPYL
jgi:hypothetical protein